MATPQTSINLSILLSNSLIFDHVVAHVDLHSLCLLRSSSRIFRHLIPAQGVRYADLSYKKSLIIPSGPQHQSSHGARGRYADDALTEDDFYGGPILSVFATMERQYWLFAISTMILDGLTVTVDVVREIIAQDRFNVRILSLRDCHQLNQRKFCQLLKYTVRPTRPKGTPKLRGLYFFGPKEINGMEENALEVRRRSPTRYPESRPSHAVNAVAVHLGSDWGNRTKAALVAEHHEDDEDKWYHSAGRLVTRSLVDEWAETLQACEGIINFDAVLCRGPRHQPSITADRISSYLKPAIATTALGPQGCQKCKTCPEGPGIFGQSPAHHLPLLAPPPFTSTSIKSAQKPSSGIRYDVPKMIARCRDCLKNRFCERCHKWWCETCYTPGASVEPEAVTNPQSSIEEEEVSIAQDVKMGAERQCFGCGQTCVDCTELFLRNCKHCNNEYCVVDNDGSSVTHCDWCNYSGRRTYDLP